MSIEQRSRIGPHEERELELMLAGSKPLSMFLEPVGSVERYFSEDEFDALVADGRLIKREVLETFPHPTSGEEMNARRVLYALPGEEWRIEAMVVVQDTYRALGPGWRMDLERIIGSLLGYDREDVEFFISNKLLGLNQSLARST